MRRPGWTRSCIAHGEFAWHSHADTDEPFLVIAGALHIPLESGTVTLNPGELHVVPRGTRHRSWSEHGADLLLFEPSMVFNTGDTPGALTVPRRELLTRRRTTRTSVPPPSLGLQRTSPPGT